MDVNRLGSLEVLGNYQKTNERLNGSLQRLASGERAAEPEVNPVLWRDVASLNGFAEKLSGFSDNLNRGAASVQVALASMDAAGQHLEQLEEKLRSAFAASPGSEERASALKAYNGLHRFVDDTAKAPDEGARRLLDDPERYEKAGDVEIRAGENNFSLTLRSRPIHTGADGLNLPKAGEAAPSELASNPGAVPVIADIDDATDEEIGEMVAYLEEAKASLQAKGKALAVDATAIEDAENFNEAFMLRNKNQAESINVPDLNQEAVLTRSFQVKNSLALNGLAGLNQTRQLALQLFR